MLRSSSVGNTTTTRSLCRFARETGTVSCHPAGTTHCSDVQELFSRATAPAARQNRDARQSMFARAWHGSYLSSLLSDDINVPASYLNVIAIERPRRWAGNIL